MSEFYEIFTITDLQFMCVDENALRRYSLKVK